MGIDISSFGREYNLAFETFQAGDRRIRLAVANGEPAFEDSREYTFITGNPLLCPLDSGEWALVTSKNTTRFKADSGADAAERAKHILVDNG
jgi:hypothetical protein